jgi:hypothetical protein
MSLILDALNRSREDNSEVPGLATRHHSAEQAPERKQVVLVLALVCALGLVAWLLWDRQRDRDGGVQAQPLAERMPRPLSPDTVSAGLPDNPRSTPPEMPQAPSLAATGTAKRELAAAETGALTVPPAQPAQQVPARKDVAPELAQPASDPAIAALYRPGNASSALPSTEASAATPMAARTEQADARLDQPGAAKQGYAEEENLDIERLLRQAESDLEDAQLAEHPAPFVSELSQQVKDGIPTVYYQRHAYSGKPGQSRVQLNGKSLGKGGSPVAGMQVEEILPGSVVLRYGDTQFRLRALNSWVNL